MGRLQLNVPGLQRSQSRVPDEQMLQILAQNPYAEGLKTAGDALSTALAKRLELRKQMAQSKAVGDALGIDTSKLPPGIDPSLVIQTASAKTASDKASSYDFAGLSADQKNMIVLNKHTGQTELRPLPQGYAPKTPVQPKPLVPYGTQDGKPVLFDPNTNAFKLGNFPGAGPVNPKTVDSRPTSQTRAMGEMATTIPDHIQEFKDTLAKAQQSGLVGPVAGRVYSDFLAGRIGSTGDENADYVLGKLKSEASLLASGMLRMHFGARGGQEMYEKFSNMDNVNKLSPAEIQGALDTFMDYANGYAKAGGQQLKPIERQGSSGKATHRWNPATGKVEVIQ